MIYCFGLFLRYKGGSSFVLGMWKEYHFDEDKCMKGLGFEPRGGASPYESLMSAPLPVGIGRRSDAVTRPLVFSAVAPWYNEPLYNDFPGIANDIVQPGQSNIGKPLKQKLDITYLSITNRKRKIYPFVTNKCHWRVAGTHNNTPY